MISQIWLIVILFLYKAFEDLKFGDKKSFERKSKYVLSVYQMFHSKYITYVKNLTSDEIIQTLIFSIMVVENFNRPRLIRLTERITSPFRGQRDLWIDAG